MDCNCQKGITFHPNAFTINYPALELDPECKLVPDTFGDYQSVPVEYSMTQNGMQFKIDTVLPAHTETQLESAYRADAAMYRSSFEAASKFATELGMKVATLQKQLDERDTLSAKIQATLESELANVTFERDRLFNHPLMRLVRWMKGWD